MYLDIAADAPVAQHQHGVLKIAARPRGPASRIEHVDALPAVRREQAYRARLPDVRNSSFIHNLYLLTDKQV